MPSFEITFFVEPQIEGGDEIEKRVEAEDEDQALEFAQRKLQDENPTVDRKHVTAWFIVRR